MTVKTCTMANNKNNNYDNDDDSNNNKVFVSAFNILNALTAGSENSIKIGK